MTRTPTRPPAPRGKVFRGSQQVRAGRLTKGQLRSTAWRRVFPDVYCCATLPVDHALRAPAAAQVAVPGAVVSGRSAAVLWGVDLAQHDDDVECTVPFSCRAGAVRGIRLTRRSLRSDEVALRRGVRTTNVSRTALDLARIQPVGEAVVALDQFLRTGLLTLDDLRAAAARLSGPGCRHVRKAAALADGLAESPQESRLRLLLHRSRLPRPTAQHVVRDARDRFVARVDSPGPRPDWPWSTRACGTENGSTSAGTGGGCTH